MMRGWALELVLITLIVACLFWLITVMLREALGL